MAWLKLREGILKLPRLLVKGEFTYTQDHMPMPARGLSTAKRLNLIRCGWEMARGRARLRFMPPVLQIEPTNHCNLKCPLCPTGLGSKARRQGCMSWDLFERILDETASTLIGAILYGWGEPFLHPELTRMIAECSRRGLLTNTSTNGHFCQTLEEALAVVDAGLTTLVIALDGSTQEVYASYRRGGDIEKVKRCAAMIEEAKRRRNSPHPYTNIRAVVTKENEHDIENIRRLAVELGVNMFSYKSVGCLTIAPEYANYETEEHGLQRFEQHTSEREVRCPFPFRQPTVYWDGSVVGCEFDYAPQASWGRIGERPFREVWNDDCAVRMRRGILGREARLAFCDGCPYRDKGQEHIVLFSEELKPPARQSDRSRQHDT